MSRFLAGLLLLMLVPVLGWPDQTGGERPAAFLQLGAGGVANAMGGAAVAARNDVSQGFWNPAGLTGTRGFQVEDQVSLLSLGQQLNYIALSNGYRDEIFFGLSFFYYSAGGDIEARNGPSLQPDALFGDTQIACLVSLAFKLDPRWSLGGNLKVLNESFNDFSGLGLGEDLGLQFRVDPRVTLGLMVQDPASFLGYDNHTESFLPPTFRIGAALSLPQNSLVAETDLEWSFDEGLRPRAGLQWQAADPLFLRAGAVVGNLTGG
ncbi:MAG TPA: hypothetical protein VHE12_01640, partial [bacterium]|nr:hypothetical protein [bacterium]